VTPSTIALLLLSVFVIAVIVWLVTQVILPLKELASQAKQLTEGDFTALSHDFGGLAALNTIRIAMNAMVGHVRRAQAQERTYIEALTNGQENERSRIARDLHDDTVQSLIAIAQSIDIAGETIDKESSTYSLLKSSRGQAVEAVDSLRRLIANLRPPILAELGLGPALQMLAEGFNHANVDIVLSGNIRRLDEAKELVLFRTVQEALWNATRHGQANDVEVTVGFHVDHIHMVVKDNGTGFSVPDSLDSLSVEGHYGLVGIKERITAIEGHLSIVSQPDEGTILIIHIPTVDTPQPDTIVRDPVCSAVIQPQQAYASLEYDEKRYYFCCPVCQGAFQSNPEMYLALH